MLRGMQIDTEMQVAILRSWAQALQSQAAAATAGATSTANTSVSPQARFAEFSFSSDVHITNNQMIQQTTVEVDVSANQEIADGLEEVARELEQAQPDRGRLDRIIGRISAASAVVGSVVGTILQIA